MHPRATRLYFDFVDPLSFVAVLEHGAVFGPGDGSHVVWVGFELVPPPEPLTGSADPFWVARLDAAGQAAARLGATLQPPDLVPWSRKAHELHLFAVDQQRGSQVRQAIFDAHFREGRDIGRVDVLVEIAGSSGMDRTEAKAVLDVDRYQAAVATARHEAAELGVTDVPGHSVAGEVRRGFPDPSARGTLRPDD